MFAIFSRTLVFRNPETGKNLKISNSPVGQAVPLWVTKTSAFRKSAEDGSIVEVRAIGARNNGRKPRFDDVDDQVPAGFKAMKDAQEAKDAAALKAQADEDARKAKEAQEAEEEEKRKKVKK